MVIELNLSFDQIDEVDAINLRFVQAEQILLEKLNNDKATLKKAIEVLDEEKTTALSFILTDKQFKGYAKMKIEKCK